MSKLGSVGLSEIELESFPDSDNFDYLFRKTYKMSKEIPRGIITLQGNQVKITTEVDRGFYILTCAKYVPGPEVCLVARRWPNSRWVF